MWLEEERKDIQIKEMRNSRPRECEAKRNKALKSILNSTNT